MSRNGITSFTVDSVHLAGKDLFSCRILHPASFCQGKFIDTHRETSDLERASELFMGMNVATKSLAQRAIVRVESLILPIRGDKIIIDSDLARIYGVTTRRLNEQVKRNIDRFPRDFMFRLTPREFDGLMSQFATSNTGRGGRRKLPYVFTEHGAIMAANILNSRQAIQMSVYVIRAFVHLRSRLWENRELARKLLELERKVDYQGGELHELFEAFRQLMAVPEKPKRQIGFQLRRV